MPITVHSTKLHGIKLIEPKVFEDSRGYFFESFNESEFEDVVGARVRFVQDNQSASLRHTLRGMHYQIGRPQGKLVRVLFGEIYDVVIDIRKSSPTFGCWEGFRVSAENRYQLWVPEGFAHGFMTLSDRAEVLYKATDFWYPAGERQIAWNDPDVGIVWPLDGTEPTLSAKDAQARRLADAEVFE